MRVPRSLAALFGLLCATPLAARAQDDDPARRAAAEALLDQASTLLGKHDYASACPKLEEVGRLQPGKVGTLLALGQCYEGAGRLASAWTTYRQAADRAAALSDARVRDAQRRADALAPRLPRLTLRVDPATQGLAGLDVKRDGLAVDAVVWGVPMPVDPGEHVIEARAPGRAPFRVAVTLEVGKGKEVTVALQPAPPAVAPPVPRAATPAAPPRAPAPPGAPGPAPALTRAATPGPAPAPTRAGAPGPTPAPTRAGAPGPAPALTRAAAPGPAPSRPGNGRRTAGVVVGGVGIAGLGVGGVLGIVTLVKSSSANGSSACKGPTSNLQDVTECNAQRDAARGIQTGAITAAVAGAVLLGAGAALVATAPRTAGKQAGAVPLTLLLHPTGASLEGRF